MEKKQFAEYGAGLIREIFGDRDENIKYVASKFGVEYAVLQGIFEIRGEAEQVRLAADAIEGIAAMIERGDKVRVKEARFACDMAEDGTVAELDSLYNTIVVNNKGRQIRPKTYGQAKYVKDIRNNSVVFGVGPAGTGKTYLAVCSAVRAFKDKQVEKIILTRPAVEAGEKLGFLPGDLGAKVDPYLRPLYDALQEMFGLDTYQKLIEKGAIEIAPLAYMRGRTLSSAFIILDEAQNATREQMKMFLTRMGEGSKIVVTGDITQIDLPNKRASGLIHATRILSDIDGIAIDYLTGKDIVRHELVMRIVNAYERLDGETDE